MKQETSSIGIFISASDISMRMYLRKVELNNVGGTSKSWIIYLPGLGFTGIVKNLKWVLFEFSSASNHWSSLPKRIIINILTRWNIYYSRTLADEGLYYSTINPKSCNLGTGQTPHVGWPSGLWPSAKQNPTVCSLAYLMPGSYRLS